MVLNLHSTVDRFISLYSGTLAFVSVFSTLMGSLSVYVVTEHIEPGRNDYYFLANVTCHWQCHAYVFPPAFSGGVGTLVPPTPILLAYTQHTPLLS